LRCCCCFVAELPAVFTGPAAIHGLLLQQLRLNAWHLVLSSLDSEITHMLGLPARLQPAAAAARAAAVVSRSSTTQQQQQVQRQGTAASADIIAAAGSAAAAASDALPSVSTGTGTISTAAAAGAAGAVVRNSSSSALQRQLLASSAGGHFSFYATLSSLVLQAVIGSAATAGEECVLQQQQQGRGDSDAAAAAAAMVVEGSRGSSRGATPAAADGSFVDGLLFGEIDVGGPWERAAAAAGGNGRMLLQDPAAAADADMQAGAAAAAARAEGVFVEPQLLSLRPLALGNLLVMQLGSLLTNPWKPRDVLQLAAVSYAYQTRQLQRQRADAMQRPQQQGSNSAAAAGGGKAGMSTTAGIARDGSIGGGSSSKAAAAMVLPQVSFMTCLSHWLAHSSSRELLRAKLDEQLLLFPGVAAQTLQCCHTCVSAIQLSPSEGRRMAAAAAAAPNSQQQRQQQRSADLDSDLKSESNVLVMLSDTSITLEGPGLGLLAGARGLLGQHSRPRDVQQAVTYLHALPGLLAPLLQQLHSSNS
jgi:hypothetical protein